MSKSKIGGLLEDEEYETNGQKFLITFFFLRRIFHVVLIIVYPENLDEGLQMVIFLLFNLMSLIIIINTQSNKPLSDRKANIFNEGSILMVGICVVIATDVWPSESSSQGGWLHISLVAISIAVNIYWGLK